jgi:hypothetical protein
MNADLLNDLAVAYLERGRVKEDDADGRLALAAADRALAINPQLRQALLNRAFALTTLKMDADANRAWRTFVESQPDAAWLMEVPGAQSR